VNRGKKKKQLQTLVGGEFEAHGEGIASRPRPIEMRKPGEDPKLTGGVHFDIRGKNLRRPSGEERAKESVGGSDAKKGGGGGIEIVKGETVRRGGKVGSREEEKGTG